ncbi:hypothetical protein PanWU01x14_250060 [Parasponia andersonii]|uniref:Secreted protein n=1 Tax=Parasponia andersonii TaxID=3476 RepID=A0A2P5BD48_PARAD|nr:hypothetical protein PanWU01x14_250060 [Parasponia andersonii]
MWSCVLLLWKLIISSEWGPCNKSDFYDRGSHRKLILKEWLLVSMMLKPGALLVSLARKYALTVTLFLLRQVRASA